MFNLRDSSRQVLFFVFQFFSCLLFCMIGARPAHAQMYYGADNFTGSDDGVWAAGKFAHRAAQERMPGLTVLYSFRGEKDGILPRGLIRDTAGNLYGPAWKGGDYDNGTVFKLSRGNKEQTLYSFGLFPDAANPVGTLAMDKVGNIYGAAQFGGAYTAGAVFKIDTAGKETILHSFEDVPDGYEPIAGLVLDPGGTLYGTTASGGVNDAGTVFKLDTSGHEAVLHSFDCASDGCEPTADLVLDGSGNLYGTTSFGGRFNQGTVFKLEPNGKLIVLHSFKGGGEGGSPSAGVTLDRSGNVYGTTYFGGDTKCNPPYDKGCGVVFRLDRAGKEKVLYAFKGGVDGGYPLGDLLRDQRGTPVWYDLRNRWLGRGLWNRFQT
jgi:uncharacterized repeat protein (TIGR03803 family)